MKTKQLFELRDHANANLWPFPDRIPHLKGDSDFNTEVGIFNTNLIIVFQELEDNIIECSKEDAQKYAGHVVEILQRARGQVNQFFRKDTPENNEYNKDLQQVEAEGVSEEPGSGLTPADSISKDKLEFPVHALALYLNKICLWGEYVVSARFVKDINDQGAEDLTPSKAEQVMLIHYTKLYSHLYKEYNSNHTTVSKIIAAIIGGEPGTINRIRNFIADPANTHRNNPFKDAELIKSLRRKLTNLDIDTTQFEKDLLRSQKSS